MQGKLNTEEVLEKRGVNWTSIRPVYIYGPLNYNPVEEWFFQRIKEGRPIPVPNSGMQVRRCRPFKCFLCSTTAAFVFECVALCFDAICRLRKQLFADRDLFEYDWTPGSSDFWLTGDAAWPCQGFGCSIRQSARKSKGIPASIQHRWRAVCYFTKHQNCIQVLSRLQNLQQNLSAFDVILLRTCIL